MTNYGIPHAKKLIQGLGGTLQLIGSRRFTPPSGRAYSLRFYRISVPGQAPVEADEHVLRMMSSSLSLPLVDIIAQLPSAAA